LAGLVAFVVYFNSAEEEVAETPATDYLWELTSADIRQLRVVDNSVQTEVMLIRDDAGQWQVESRKLSGSQIVPAQPADPGLAEYGASLVSTIFLRRTLTETTELGQFGLIAPAYALHVTRSDGTELSVQVGYKTPTEDGYYVLVPGEPHAKIVSATALDPIFAFVANPPLPPTPVPTVMPETEVTPASETATPAS